MSFHEVRFPVSISFGSAGGPERRTEIVTLRNGFEERNSPWAHSRRRYDAGLGMRSRADLAEIIAFFEARHGQLFGFRWRDWSDYQSCAPGGQPGPADQVIGTGDGTRTAFQLVKGYRSGDQVYERPISKPVAESVRVAVDDAEVPVGAGFTLDPATGVVTLAVAPANGAEVTAGFEFDVPVRFDTDRIDVSLAAYEAGEVPSVPVIEVRV
jgi:uncharacterized protein (TIGR02217 family)